MSAACTERNTILAAARCTCVHAIVQTCTSCGHTAADVLEPYLLLHQEQDAVVLSNNSVNRYCPVVLYITSEGLVAYLVLSDCTQA